MSQNTISWVAGDAMTTMSLVRLSKHGANTRYYILEGGVLQNNVDTSCCVARSPLVRSPRARRSKRGPRPNPIIDDVNEGFRSKGQTL